MSIRINDIAPDFTAPTTAGTLSFHEWIGSNWCVLVSHPKDFTPICTTEIGLMACIEQRFTDLNVKLIAHSIDPVEEHLKWVEDILVTQGVKPQFPIIGDEKLIIAKLYDMLPQDAIPGNRTAMQNATVRAVYVIDPNKKVRAMTFYPMSAGRSFDEVLRLIRSLQMSDKYKIATPVNWKEGDAVLIPPAISNEEAAKMFPQGWTTKERPYLRYVNL